MTFRNAISFKNTKSTLKAIRHCRITKFNAVDILKLLSQLSSRNPHFFIHHPLLTLCLRTNPSFRRKLSMWLPPFDSKNWCTKTSAEQQHYTTKKNESKKTLFIFEVSVQSAFLMLATWLLFYYPLHRNFGNSTGSGFLAESQREKGILLRVWTSYPKNLEKNMFLQNIEET